MLRAFSAMTSFRPHVNPAEFKLRIARRIADFFRLRIVEPERPVLFEVDARDVAAVAGVPARPEHRPRLAGVAFSVISRTYLRDR